MRSEEEYHLPRSAVLIWLSVYLMLVGAGVWIVAPAIGVAAVQLGFVIGAIGFFLNIPAILRWIDES